MVINSVYCRKKLSNLARRDRFHLPAETPVGPVKELAWEDGLFTLCASR